MDYNFLSQTPLFRGAAPEEIPEILEHLDHRLRSFKKNMTIYNAGDIIDSLGIVLRGSVSVENDDVWGNKSVLSVFGPGEIFAETYAAVKDQPSMVSVYAREDSEILFINVRKMLASPTEEFAHTSLIVRNLLAISLRKNLALSRRIFNTSSKSIRGRLLSFLSFESAQNHSTDFYISYDRQQLADFLSVDRSALSKELGKMKEEGLIDFKKNHFILRTPEEFTDY